MEKKIVIVGAGYAGILTAKKLAKKFKKDRSVTITLIDKNPFHTMLTELHEVAASRVDEESIRIDLKKVFAERKVNVVHDKVETVDFENKVVVGSIEKYEYDYLVMAAGSQPTYFGVPGAEEFSYKLWSYEDAILLKDHIHNSFRKAASATSIEEKKKLLSFYVVGAGFTGVEMVGELAEYAPILCEKFAIDPSLVGIYNVDILKRTVPILPEKLSNKVERRLEKMGVTLMLNTGVVGIGKDFIEVKAGDEVTKHTAGTVIWTAGIESADITNEAAKTLSSVNRGRIKTDSYLRSIDNDHVFIVGDNMFFIPEGEEVSVPQMVENCEHSAGTAAKNIAVAITGNGTMSTYKPSFHGVMVCVGGRYGVARVGLPKMMFNLPSFLAMLSKHFINIIYFIQILGWNKVFSYIRHEFFTIRNCRSFVGGHFSNRTASFLIVPLRVWLGSMWLFEGIIKVADGWFKTPKLTGFFSGANAWYETILHEKIGVITAVAPVVDGVSSATGTSPDVAQQVGTAIMNWNCWDLIRFVFVSGKEPLHCTVNDFAFRLDIPLMNSFLNSFVIPNDSMQLFMQGFIVVAEILVGLALIGGLFTTPAAAFSLILQFMFICTTGLYMGTFWMVFAAIAVLVGAGRSLGLDYYVMPYLKKAWKKIPLVRRLYIYND